MSGSAPTSPWAPGYDTVGLLRQGTRARIVRATRTTSEADVVLKVLPPDEGRAELEWLRALSSVPGVVPLLDAGSTTAGESFVAQPYYPDGSFADMLSRMGPAPVSEASAVARSVAVALGALHSRGSAHNGVVPGNVLRAGRTPVLTGFGATQPIGPPLAPPAPESEAFLHSPPEALRGESRSPASDVYMLASTLWTLLVGRALFSINDGSPFDPHVYATRVLNDPAPPVPRADVSRKLRGVLSRALAKRAEDRYQSTAEFSAAFEQARTSRPVKTVSGSTGGGPVSTAAPSGSQIQPSFPPSGPPTAATGPRPPFSGPQAPFAPMVTTGVDGHPAPADPDPSPPPVDAGPETPFPPERPLPTPSERAAQGAVPELSANSTADIAMARLRGEEISPLVTWSRLKGWSGVTEDSYLPMDDEPPETESEPVWEPVGHESPIRPRWREHLHIAVTVSGVLVASMVASVFAATNTPEPVVAVAAEETEEEPVEEDSPAEPVAEPSPLPEVSAPSDVMLEDTLSAVTLNWVDNTGGTGSYFVVGWAQGHDPRTLARTGPGAVTAQVPTENTQVEYCFTLVAVDGGSAPAEEVCTTRAADRAAEAERQAEEEAEREAEEEEEDPSPPPSPAPDSDD